MYNYLNLEISVKISLVLSLIIYMLAFLMLTFIGLNLANSKMRIGRSKFERFLPFNDYTN